MDIVKLLSENKKLGEKSEQEIMRRNIVHLTVSAPLIKENILKMQKKQEKPKVGRNIIVNSRLNTIKKTGKK
jgi:hypothetical protein